MWPKTGHTNLDAYHQVQAERFKRYEARLAAGQHQPFVYPWDSLPALYLLLAVLLLPRLSRRYSRLLQLPPLILITGHCAYVVRSCRTIGFSGGYGIGLSAAWGCIMTFALLFFNNVGTDFERLETRQVHVGSQEKCVNGSASSSTIEDARSLQARSRNATGQRKTDYPEQSSVTATTYAPYRLAWQAYPPNLGHRLDWTIDLLTCFRGVDWNFRDPTLSKLGTPKRGDSQESKLDSKPESSPSIDQVRKSALFTFLQLYLAIDVLKFVASKDPYFHGASSIDIPSLSVIYTHPPTLLKASRLTITAMSVYTILNFLFQLCPLFFAGLPLIIPYPTILSITRIPLLSPSMYEPYWGPLLPSVAEKGLAGFWGRFWHQLFRFGISQPSAYIIKRFGLDPRSNTGRSIHVLTAFCFSGTIHACASYTSFPPVADTTHPITGPWLFFILQGMGVLLQAYVTRILKSRLFPVWLRQAGNLLFVLVWAWYTGPLLADDFARCGVWLFEPLPISFAQGLGGGGWWRWGGRWAGWWSDPNGKWWKSGIAMY